MQAVFLFATAVVPVIDKACSLDRLGYDIGCMTCEQQVVPRLHPPGKPREDHRVEGKSGSHGAGYDLLILAQISDGSQGETEVGNWSPEMSAKEVFAGCGRPDPGEEGGSHDGRANGSENDQKTDTPPSRDTTTVAGATDVQRITRQSGRSLVDVRVGRRDEKGATRTVRRHGDSDIRGQTGCLQEWQDTLC
jgi:hypothetical protein